MLKNLKFNKKKDQKDELVIKRVDSPEMMTSTTTTPAASPPLSRPPLGIGALQMHRNSGASTSSESTNPRTPTDSPAINPAFISLPQNREEDECYYSEGESSLRNKVKATVVPLTEGITYSRGIEFKEEVKNIPVDDIDPSDDESLFEERPVVNTRMGGVDDLQDTPTATSTQSSFVVTPPQIITPASSPPPKPASPKIEVTDRPHPVEDHKKDDHAEPTEPIIRSEAPKNLSAPVIRKVSIDVDATRPPKVDVAVYANFTPAATEGVPEKLKKDSQILPQAEPKKTTEAKSVEVKIIGPRTEMEQNFLSTETLKTELQNSLSVFIRRMDNLFKHNAALAETLSQAKETHRRAGDHARTLEQERDSLKNLVDHLERTVNKVRVDLKESEEKCSYWKNKHDVVDHEKGMAVKDKERHALRFDDISRLLDVQSEKAQKSEEERRKAEDECRHWKEKYLDVVRNHHESQETGRADARPSTLTVPEIRATTPLRTTEDRHPEERRRVLSEFSGPPAGISLSVQDHSTITVPVRPKAPGPYEGSQSLPQAFTFPDFMGVWDSSSNHGDDESGALKELESEDQLEFERSTHHTGTRHLGDTSRPQENDSSAHYDFSQ